jgi:hypothetical protein
LFPSFKGVYDDKVFFDIVHDWIGNQWSFAIHFCEFVAKDLDGARECTGIWSTRISVCELDVCERLSTYSILFDQGVW